MPAGRARLGGLVGALMLAFVACGSTPTSSPNSTPESPTLEVPSRERDVPPQALATDRDDVALACAKHGLVLEVPASIPRAWDGRLVTGGEADVVVRWCGPEPVTVRFIEVLVVTQDLRVTHTLEGRRLEVGQFVVRRVHTGAALGPSRVRARALVSSGETAEDERHVEVVESPERSTAIAQCNACGGSFRSFGMSAREMCDCPTRDAGTRCLSSVDCEGACLFDHDEVQPAGSTGPEGRSCDPGEELRLRVGRCHHRQRLFGCKPVLLEPRAHCSPPSRSGRAPIVCID